jgi:anthranilate phosphoribosyltransferase
VIAFHQDVLQRILDRREITTCDMVAVLSQIERSDQAPMLTAALLVGLQAKRSSVDELVAMVHGMREFAQRVQIREGNCAVNIASVGIPGGLDILTAAMFVVAATGVKVATHACNGISPSRHSVDVFELLELNQNVSAQVVSESIDVTGMGFISLATHHPVMNKITAVVHELGVRDIFSFLLPLTNPADARNHLIAMPQMEMIGRQVRVIQQLGASHALVVHSRERVHGVSLAGPTAVVELRGSTVSAYEIRPEQFGLKRTDDCTLTAGGPGEFGKRLVAALDNSPGSARDCIILNAALALYAANAVDSIDAGVVSARRAIASGGARGKVDELVRFHIRY